MSGNREFASLMDKLKQIEKECSRTLSEEELKEHENGNVEKTGEQELESEEESVYYNEEYKRLNDEKV